jgi:sterol desaturase/sphingolipid hydroxylase (fatty acid hydroxylase superfamily)
MLRIAANSLVQLFAGQPLSPWLPVGFYGPIFLAGILWGILDGQLPAWTWVGLFGAGLLLWTLLEYMIHSLAFHHTIRFLRLQSVQASHSQHHHFPNDPQYMMSRLGFTVPVALALSGCLYLVLGLEAAVPVIAGLILGYLVYEVLHYQIHCRRKARWLPRALVRHHLYHHHKDQACCYGVTSPLWDWVFGTTPPRRRQAAGPVQTPHGYRFGRSG